MRQYQMQSIHQFRPHTSQESDFVEISDFDVDVRKATY